MSLTDAEISVQTFALAVYRYCFATGGSVTSWIRTHSRNNSVGGVADSYHLTGLGCDIVVESKMSTDDRHKLAASLGLRLVVESDHDHVQLLR